MAEKRPLSTVGLITSVHMLVYTMLVCIDDLSLAGLFAIIMFWFLFKYFIWMLYSFSLASKPKGVYLDSSKWDCEDKEWHNRGTWVKWEDETC